MRLEEDRKPPRSRTVSSVSASSVTVAAAERKQRESLSSDKKVQWAPSVLRKNFTTHDLEYSKLY